MSRKTLIGITFAIIILLTPINGLSTSTQPHQTINQTSIEKTDKKSITPAPPTAIQKEAEKAAEILSKQPITPTKENIETAIKKTITAVNTVLTGINTTTPTVNCITLYIAYYTAGTMFLLALAAGNLILADFWLTIIWQIKFLAQKNGCWWAFKMEEQTA